MNKNPLTTPIIVLGIGDAFTVMEAATQGKVEVFTAIAWLQGIVFLILYLKKSRFAGSYMFYSTLPFFPIYFGLKAIGLNPPPVSWEVGVIVFVIYVSAILFLWKLKREYDLYLLGIKKAASAVE